MTEANDFALVLVHVDSQATVPKDEALDVAVAALHLTLEPCDPRAQLVDHVLLRPHRELSLNQCRGSHPILPTSCSARLRLSARILATSIHLLSHRENLPLGGLRTAKSPRFA